METRITVAELKDALSDILKRVCERGERFVIVEDGRPVAALGPQGDEPGLSLIEFMKQYQGLPLPDDQFADDLEAIHGSQPRIEPPSWDA